MTAANGVATFSNLSISQIGSKNLTASSAGLTSAVSSAFNITAGAATHLAFVQQPTDAQAGATIAPAVTVQLRDASNNPVTISGADISLSLTTGTGTLSGTVTVQTINGLATFNNLSIDLVGAKNLTASSAGLSSAVSAPFNITAGAATQLIYLTQPNNALAGGNFGPVTLQLADAYGNPVTTAGVSVTLTVGSGTGTINGTVTLNTDANGQVVFNNINLGPVGVKQLTATAGSITANSSSFTVSAGPATQLAFVQQPTDAVAGATIAPAVTVQLRDAYNNPVTASGVDISLTLTTGTGTLSGTVTVQTINGLATFNNLSIDLVGAKNLTASSAGLSSAVSAPFNITAGAAAQLAFVQQPTDAVAGATIAPAVTVQLRDTYNNPVTASGVDISLSLTTGTGTLSGTVTVQTINGLATFNNLSIDLVGTKNLTASSAGLSSAVSAPFNITAGAATQLIYLTQPNDALAGGNFGPVTLQLADAYGNPVTTAGVSVTLTLGSGTGAIIGTVTVDTDANGQVVFDNINIEPAGVKELTATAGLITADSDPFTVSAGPATQLAFVQQPTDAVAGATIAPAVTVQLRDAYNNPVTASGVEISLTLTTGTGTLSGTAAVQTINGLATFNNLSIELVGAKNLTASSAGLSSAVSAPFNITAGAATQLIYLTQPNDAVAGDNFGPVTLQLADAYGNPVTTAGVSVTLTVGSGTGTINGTVTLNTDANGQVVFDNINLGPVGLKELTATAGSITADSDPFTISVGAATQLVFVQQPTDTVVAETISPAVTVQLQDAYNNPVTTSGVEVSLALTTGTGTLTGTIINVETVNGVATFSDLSIDQVGSKNLMAFSAGLSSVISAPFNITAGAATQLIYLTQPNDALAGDNFGPVTLQLADVYGNPVTTAGVSVTLTLRSGTGAINGTVTVDTDANGQVVFDNINIGPVGVKELTATAGLITADSDPFTVSAGPAAAVVLTGPVSVMAGQASGNLTLTVVDQYQNPTVVSQDTLFNLTTSSGATGSFDPDSTVTILNGESSTVFTYTDSQPGNPTITATRISGDNVGFDTHEIEVLPLTYAVSYEFVQEPVLEVAGELFVLQPVIQTLDGYGNFTADISNLLPDDSLVTLSLIGGPGTLAGTLTLDLNNTTPGVITWTNLAASMAGTNWQLVASNSVLGSITSSVFVVISPSVTPPPFGTNGVPHALLSDPAGPIGLWLSNLRGDKYSWYKPSLGVLWRDLVVANYNSNVITVRLCRDNGTFEPPVVYETGLNPFAVRSGFFSNNTFEDVAVANHGTNTVSIFRTVRNGTGLLQPRVDYVVGTTPNPGLISIAAAKASGGSYQDIFVANANENTVSVLRNVAGAFVLSTNIPVGLNPLSVSVGDMDGDGLLDIVTSNQGDGTLTILRGRPGFTFEHWQTVTLFPGGQPAPTHAQLADLNADGRLDIAVANGGSNTVSILLQTSTQEFPVYTNYNVGLSPRSILLRDLNRDGLEDIAIANYDGASVDVLLGNGDGSFERGGRIPVGRNPMCVVGSNFNGDRATDIAVSNYGDDTISLFLYSGPLSKDMEVTTLQNQSVEVTLIGDILGGKDLGYLVERLPVNGTLSGTPPNLVYTPSTDFVGTDTFTYRTYDTNYVGPERFQFPVNTGAFNTNVASPAATITITVRPVNQQPSFSLTTDHIVVPSSASLQTVENFAVNISAGLNEPDQAVTFNVTVTNKSFFSVSPTITPEGQLVFRPAHSAAGTNYITVRLKDNGGTANGGINESVAHVFAIEVLPNVAPSFSLTGNIIEVPAFSSLQIKPGFATGISAGLNEAGQTTTFILTVTNSAFFAVQPSIATNGTLAFAPSWLAEGTNYVRVRLRDNGPTAIGGVNESTEQVFAVVVTGTDNNPFLAGKTVIYNGLFSETANGVKFHSAGYATIKVSPRLGYSAKLFLDGNVVTVSGKFNVDGTATITTKNRFSKFGKAELTLNLALDIASGGDRLTGTIAEGATWSSGLTADRMVWLNEVNEATAFTNNYTMLLGGFADKADGPVGNGHAVMLVDKRGRARVAGALADGHLVKQATFVSEEGYVPVFSPGYKVARLNGAGKSLIETKGFVMGWLKLQANALGNLAPQGSLHWINTGWTNSTYSNGFTNHNVPILSSRWVAPLKGATEPVVNMNSVKLSFADGDLGADAFEAKFLVTASTTLAVDRTAVNPNTVKAALAPKTGVFKGTFVHPATQLPTRFSGVLLQDYNIGSGFFMGPTEGGSVEFDSAD